MVYDQSDTMLTNKRRTPSCVCWVTNLPPLKTIQNQNIKHPLFICKIINTTTQQPMPWLPYKACGYRIPMQVI